MEVEGGGEVPGLVPHVWAHPAPGCILLLVKTGLENVR